MQKHVENLNQQLPLPQWDNTTEYKSFTSEEFQTDYAFIEATIQKLNSFTKEFSKNLTEVYAPAAEQSILACQQVLSLQTQAIVIFYNMTTYTSCEQSLDAQNKEAEKYDSKLSSLKANLDTSLNPWTLFISKTTQENFTKIMNSDLSKDYLFYYSHQRKMSEFLLSEAEENILTKLKSTGHTAWGNLYDAISGTARVDMAKDGKPEKISIAQAASLTKVNDSEVRKMAWQGLQNVWTEHKQSVAQILNALSGWRHDVNSMRSINKKIDFLDQPLHSNRITDQTLQAMMTAIA